MENTKNVINVVRFGIVILIIDVYGAVPKILN